MKPVRELDRAVAEKVMGFCIACSRLEEHDPEILVPASWVGRDVGRTTATTAYHVPPPETDSVTIDLGTGLPVDRGHNQCTLHDLHLIYEDQAEPYSTDIAAAWEVWEKLISDGWYPDLITSYGPGHPIYRCELHRGGDGDDDHHVVYADTAPHAICLAALKSVGALPTEGDG